MVTAAEPEGSDATLAAMASHYWRNGGVSGGEKQQPPASLPGVEWSAPCAPLSGTGQLSNNSSTTGSA